MNEDKKQQARDCYKRLMAQSRTCSGCDLQHLCKMPADNAKWLFGEFLPAIDPTGQVFGCSLKAE